MGERVSRGRREVCHAVASEFSVTSLEMSWLAQHPPTLLNPMRDPLDHFAGLHTGFSEKLLRFRCIVKQRRRTFFGMKLGFDAKVAAEFHGELANRKSFRPGNIQHKRR